MNEKNPGSRLPGSAKFTPSQNSQL